MEKMSDLYPKLGKIWSLDKNDKDVIELLSAIVLSRIQEIERIFLMYVAPSGCGKSTLFNLFKNKDNTYFIEKFTKSSLSSGMVKKNKLTGQEYDPSLAPKLKGKVVFVSDMAKLTTSGDKEALWSAMIGLYDGHIRESYGNGKTNDYENLNVTLVCGATPVIYSQMLLIQQLGTRFLFYNREGRNKEEVLEKAEESFFLDKNKIFEEIREEFQNYLNNRTYQQDKVLSPETKARLMKWALTSAKLRANAKVELSSGQLIEQIIVEEPTRIFKQFLVIFKGLLSLEDNYPEERALEIIGKLAISNCNPNRVEVLKCLINYNTLHPEGFSRRDVASYLKISDKTCLGELNSLFNLGLVSKIERVIDPDRDLVNYKFKIEKNNEIVRHLAEHYEITDNLDLDLNVEVIKYERS